MRAAPLTAAGPASSRVPRLRRGCAPRIERAHISINGQTERLRRWTDRRGPCKGTGLRQSKTVNYVLTYQNYDLAGPMPLVIEDGPTAYITGPGGLPIEQVQAGGVVHYYSHDQQGSTTALTDATGNATTTYTYDPYGKQTTAGSAIVNPFGYDGQYADAETGFQYLRARYYDPTTGQFVSRDPAGILTHAPYSFANDSPANMTDLLGLSPGQCSSPGAVSTSQSALPFTPPFPLPFNVPTPSRTFVATAGDVTFQLIDVLALTKLTFDAFTLLTPFNAWAAVSALLVVDTIAAELIYYQFHTFSDSALAPPIPQVQI